jgi:MoaA/NifB/PqqE/SkfB family radical SAM enzyme
VTLRQLSDFKGEELVRRILALVDELRPLHLSIVGGDPLVRYREMETLMPLLLRRGIHVQVVTSAFRSIPASWAGVRNLTVAVSIDGLQPDHDVRRQPATYERILKNIAGHKITVHCTITSQMMERDGYLDDFARFWNARDEVHAIWFSMFTPQRGDYPVERLAQEQRVSAVRQLMDVQARYSKVQMPKVVLEQFLRPPDSPADCIFARTTETISADLRTRITPCQFGGEPDCAECGCYASMGLAAVGAVKLAGFVPVEQIFRISADIGARIAQRRTKRAPAVEDQRPPDPAEQLVSISRASGEDA